MGRHHAGRHVRRPRASAAGSRSAPCWRRNNSPRRWCPARMARPTAATRWPAPPAMRCWTSCWRPASWRTCSARAASCAPNSTRSPANIPQVYENARGMGLLLGLKCAIPVGQVQAACVAEGLMAITAGDNVLRLAPPLVVTDSDLDEAVVDAAPRHAPRAAVHRPRRRRNERLAAPAAARSRAGRPSKATGPRHFLDLRDFDARDVAADAGRRCELQAAAACRRVRWPARRWR